MSSLKYRDPETGEWDRLKGGAGVGSFNGRAGAVKPASGDYTAEMVGAISTEDKGAANGIATLGTDGKLSDAQIPSLAKLGAAPAWYGLGISDVAALKYVTSDASVVDTYKSNGWYGYVSNSGVNLIPNVGSNICAIAVTVINANYVKQTAITVVGRILTRYCSGGTWGSWEWLNPHMTPGEEYRTTEQYNGKPVYVKLVRYTLTADTGNASGVTNFAINGNASNVDSVVDMSAVYVQADGAKSPLPVMSGSGDTYLSINRIASGTLYTVVIVNKAVIPKNAYFDVVYRYTKTTDS